MSSGNAALILATCTGRLGCGCSADPSSTSCTWNGGHGDAALATHAGSLHKSSMRGVATLVTELMSSITTNLNRGPGVALQGPPSRQRGGSNLGPGNGPERPPRECGIAQGNTRRYPPRSAPGRARRRPTASTTSERSGAMPIIKASPNRVRSVRHICRVQEPNRDALVLNARFIGDSVASPDQARGGCVAPFLSGPSTRGRDSYVSANRRWSEGRRSEPALQSAYFVKCGTPQSRRGRFQPVN